MKINELEPGEWFLYPEQKRTAQLKRLGASGAVIRYADESSDVRVTDMSDVERVVQAEPVGGVSCGC